MRTIALNKMWAAGALAVGAAVAVVLAVQGSPAIDGTIFGRDKVHVPVPQGEPQSPLVSLETARAAVGFPIATPADIAVESVWVADDASHVRLHLTGGMILVETPTTDARHLPNGLEFETSVKGMPALGVRGDVPATDQGPVSQLKWWTGHMLYNLYGPVPYETVVAVANGIPA